MMAFGIGGKRVYRVFGKKSVPLLLLVAFILVLIGCGNNAPRETCGDTSFQQHTIGNPTPADFLSDQNADIFYFGDVVYSNAEHLDWAKERKYTKTELLGEITKQTSQADIFVEGTANKLFLGTKIFDTDTEIFVAIVNGKEIRYIKMVEG